MLGYQWKGNVRQLKNVIESLVVMDIDVRALCVSKSVVGSEDDRSANSSCQSSSATNASSEHFCFFFLFSFDLNNNNNKKNGLI